MSDIEKARMDLVHACLMLASDMLAGSHNASEWVDDAAKELVDALRPVDSALTEVRALVDYMDGGAIESPTDAQIGNYARNTFRALCTVVSRLENGA